MANLLVRVVIEHFFLFNLYTRTIIQPSFLSICCRLQGIQFSKKKFQKVKSNLLDLGKKKNSNSANSKKKL
jgi:hypothetical protein